MKKILYPLPFIFVLLLHSFVFAGNGQIGSEVILKNGNVMKGEVLTEVFELRTHDYKLLQFDAADIKDINFESEKFQFKIGFHYLDVVVLRNGEKSIGFVLNDTVHFKLKVGGSALLLKKSDLKTISFE